MKRVGGNYSNTGKYGSQTGKPPSVALLSDAARFYLSFSKLERLFLKQAGEKGLSTAKQLEDFLSDFVSTHEVEDSVSLLEASAFMEACNQFIPEDLDLTGLSAASVPSTAEFECPQFLEISPRSLVLREDGRQTHPAASLTDLPCKEIHMCEDGHVFCPAGKSQTIFTDGLNGCQALAVIARHADGATTVYLSHFLPDELDRQKAAFKDFVRDAPRIKEAGTRYKVLVCSPGVWEKNLCAEFFEIKSTDENLVASLFNQVAQHLPNEAVERVTAPYREGDGEKVFSIRIPADRQDAVYYDSHGYSYGQLWFDGDAGTCERETEQPLSAAERGDADDARAASSDTQVNSTAQANDGWPSHGPDAQ